MKKLITPIILSLLFFISISLYSFVGSGEPTYTFSESQVMKIYSQSQVIKSIVPKSDIPMKDAIPILQDADSLSQIIVNQYKKLHDTTSKK